MKHQCLSLGRSEFLESEVGISSCRRASARRFATGRRTPAKKPPQGVPSMGRILLDERSQSEPMTATVAEAQGVVARRSRKKREANPRP